MAKKTLSSDQMMTAILSYLSILVIIPLIAVKKKDEFIKFHIKQGIILLVVEIILAIIQRVLLYLFFFGNILWDLIGILWLVILVVAVIAIIKAIQGEMWKIPVVSNYTDSIKI
ncbi:MAG: DUF4870 domain-containing protein [Nanoarchaeota archaeon]|nr:MAG: DUF4870 domain-containing protein [Nanoarchaeota archaeon]